MPENTNEGVGNATQDTAVTFVVSPDDNFKEPTWNGATAPHDQHNRADPWTPAQDFPTRLNEPVRGAAERQEVRVPREARRWPGRGALAALVSGLVLMTPSLALAGYGLVNQLVGPRGEPPMRDQNPGNSRVVDGEIPIIKQPAPSQETMGTAPPANNS
jgi:hypothetical protein